MSKSSDSMVAVRKPRADAERNRVRLLGVAKAAFGEVGAGVSLEEIARRAEVGIGTLYRHFPTRDAMLEAVYRHEVEQLAGAAQRLSSELSPTEALRAWMRLFIDYIATKKVIVPALSALAGGSSELFATTGAQIKAALRLLVEQGIASGDIRPDVEHLDLVYALIGFVKVNDREGWEQRALRLIDILIAGLRP